LVFFVFLTRRTDGQTDGAHLSVGSARWRLSRARRLSRRLAGAYQAPIRRRQAPTGSHLAPISDRQTDSLTYGQKHGHHKKKKKYTKNTPNFGVFLVYFWCFLSLGRAGRTGTPICRKHALASIMRQAPITRRLAGAYQAPIRRRQAPTGLIRRLFRTDGFTDRQKHGNQKNKN
jgi:hypothetical protein